MIEKDTGYSYNFPLFQPNGCNGISINCGSPVMWFPGGEYQRVSKAIFLSLIQGYTVTNMGKYIL